MKVQLKKHTGRNAASGKTEEIGQYMVFADGNLVGFLPYEAGSKILLIARVAPLDRHQIERDVRAKLHPHPVGGTVMIGERPQPPKDPENEFDPFGTFAEDEVEVFGS